MTMLYEERFARKMYASYFSFKPAKHVIAYNAKVKKVVGFPPCRNGTVFGILFHNSYFPKKHHRVGKGGLYGFRGNVY